MTTKKINIYSNIHSKFFLFALGLVMAFGGLTPTVTAVIETPDPQISAPKVCKAGFTLNNDECSYVAKYTCSQGSLSGANCVLESNRQTTYSCNGTDTLSNTNCTVVAKTYPAISNGTTAEDCPAGYGNYSDTQCSKNANYQADPVIPTTPITPVTPVQTTSTVPVVSPQTPALPPVLPVIPPTPETVLEPKTNPLPIAPIQPTFTPNINSNINPNPTNRNSIVATTSAQASSNISNVNSIISSTSNKINTNSSIIPSTNLLEVNLKNTKGDMIAIISPNTTIKNTKNEEVAIAKVNFYEPQNIQQNIPATFQNENENTNNTNQTKTKIFGFGQEGEHLIFSKPVKITANLDSSFLNQDLNIQVKHFGEKNFGTTGLTTNPNANCNSNGSVDAGNNKVANLTTVQTIFYTCGASTFSITAQAQDLDKTVVNKGVNQEINNDTINEKPTSLTANKSNSFFDNLLNNLPKGINLILAISTLVLLILIVSAAFIYRNIRRKPKQKVENNYHTNSINKLPKPTIQSINKLPTVLPTILPISDIKNSFQTIQIPATNIPRLSSNLSLSDYDKAMVAEEMETLQDDFMTTPPAQLPPVPPAPTFVIQYEHELESETNDGTDAKLVGFFGDDSVIPALQNDMTFEDLVGNNDTNNNTNFEKPTHSIPHFKVDPSDQIVVITGQNLHDNPVVNNQKANQPLHLHTDSANQLSLNDKQTDKYSDKYGKKRRNKR